MRAMPFKFSGNLLINTPAAGDAARFYRDVLGLEVYEEAEEATGFLSNDHYLYFAKKDGPSFVYEFNVPDVEEARRELEATGCQVVVWEGKGGDCYMRDPFGMVFNLWEDPDSF
jgi:predicted enzyme related to lactoylglutathione lyase